MAYCPYISSFLLSSKSKSNRPSAIPTFHRFPTCRNSLADFEFPAASHVALQHLSRNSRILTEYLLKTAHMGFPRRIGIGMTDNPAETHGLVMSSCSRWPQPTAQLLRPSPWTFSFHGPAWLKRPITTSLRLPGSSFSTRSLKFQMHLTSSC